MPRSVFSLRRSLIGLAAALALGSAAYVALPDGATETTTLRSGRLGERTPARKGVARQRIARQAEGTYIRALLEGQPPSLRRWRGRPTRPVAVWISVGNSADGWTPAFTELAQGAFAEWTAAGVPLRFDYVRDSSLAEVRVRWTAELADQRDGRIVWIADGDGWVRNADIVLAMRGRDGSVQSGKEVRAIALHEVGHLLGLEHSRDSTDVMASLVEVDVLSDRDRATARLLYSLPAGRVD